VVLSKVHGPSFYLERGCYTFREEKQSLYSPGQAVRAQDVEAPRFKDTQHMGVVRLSALRTGCPYPPENIPGTHFC
jgi:hypothetical protein